jgi:hypothetical protein
MTDINYKEEMKLTDEEIEAIKPTLEECAEITAAMELYKPPEFKGCFANDEHDKLTKRKVADAAQERCLRYLSSMELPELQKQIAEILEKYVQQVLVDGRSSAEIYADEILAIIQPILAAQRAEIEELEERVADFSDLIDLQIDEIAEMDGYETAQADTMNDLKAQLSTARAETAKEIIGRLEGAYLAAPKFKDKIILQRQIEKLKVEYLAPDKEGGK